MDETKDLPEPIDTSNDDDNKNAISADLIRGHINTIILRTLYERDKYGYEIIEEIEKKSHGQYSLKQPTLYSALKRLESQGYINAYWKTDEVSLGGRRKYYTLTDSGREITEKNQAEWEYSRTVIDNLISDRSFDFSQPAPTAVDFKILKKSTSRVPVVKDDDDEDDEEESKKINEVKTITQTENIVTQVAQPVEVVYVSSTAANNDVSQSDAQQQTTQAATVPTQDSEQIQTQIQEELQRQIQEQVQLQLQETLRQQQQAESAKAEAALKEAKRIQEAQAAMDEEQRKLVHENYMRLISEPVAPPEKEVDVVPVSENIDTDKLIYNNKPETERDYRNLINNIFDKTVNTAPRPPVVEESKVSATSVVNEDVSAKAENDGLKVNSSDYVVDSRRKTYNRGSTLFKSSLIVSIILLLEFTLSLIFKDKLGVSIAYPFVILALAAAQLLIFGVLYYTDLGKSYRKPSSTAYISACIIVTVILIFIIFIVSLLLNVNFASAGDITAKIVLPCIVALNIPVFAVCFYAFSKN